MHRRSEVVCLNTGFSQRRNIVARLKSEVAHGINKRKGNTGS